jgi:tRNA (guanine-N7-)-methyltransferase
MAVEETRHIKSFGRRLGKSLSNLQKDLLTSLLPKITLEISTSDIINVKALFSPKIKEYVLEIGFGTGEHIAAQAKQNQSFGYLGCEPYINGVACLLKEIKDYDLENIRIWQDDALLLLKKIQNEIFSQVYVLFPDPWPKTRHYKRRIIQKDFLDLIYSKLKTNGELIIATDHNDYKNWIEHELNNHSGFVLASNDYNPLVKTKYYKKAEALGDTPRFFHYKKNNLLV